MLTKGPLHRFFQAAQLRANHAGSQPRQIEQVCDRAVVVDGLLDGGQQLGGILGEKATSSVPGGHHQPWPPPAGAQVVADRRRGDRHLIGLAMASAGRPLPPARAASPDPRPVSRPRSALGGRGRPTYVPIDIQNSSSPTSIAVVGGVDDPDTGLSRRTRWFRLIDAPCRTRSMVAAVRIRFADPLQQRGRSAAGAPNRQTGPATQPQVARRAHE